MALLDILVGASGGLLQGAQDLRQRQIQDEQIQRQKALDQLTMDQFQFQKDQAAIASKRAEAGLRLQGIQGAREGLFQNSDGLNQFYRDSGLSVDQVPARATMHLSPLMQAAMGRKSLTSNNLTGPDGQRVVTDRDYAAGQYGVVRSNQLADTAAQRAAEAQRLAEERAFQERQAAAQRAFQEKLAKLQGSLQLQTAQAQRDYTPSFSTVTGQDGQVYSFNQRNGGINPLGIHAQDRASSSSADQALSAQRVESAIRERYGDPIMYSRDPKKLAEVEAVRRGLYHQYGLPDPYPITAAASQGDALDAWLLQKGYGASNSTPVRR